MADQSASAQTGIVTPEGLKLLGVTFAHCALIARLHGLCFEESWNSATVAQVLRLAGAFGLLATVGLATNTNVQFRWFSANEVTGPPMSIDVGQIDLNMKF